MVSSGAHAALGRMPSPAPFVCTRRPLSRRRFLRGAGVALGLPLLDAMLPGLVRAATASSSPLAPDAKPRRMLGICNDVGLLADQFFPRQAGRNYALSPYLEVLREQREDFTVFSGVSHPGLNGGHQTDMCFLTAAPQSPTVPFRNTISLDQHIAAQIGRLTRFPSLTLAVNTRERTLSYSALGDPIIPEDKAADVFRRLFLAGNAAEVEERARELEAGRSILDALLAQSRQLQRTMGARDRERLDRYFTSVRELEQRLETAREWEKKPKPVVRAAAPVDAGDPARFIDKVRMMYDLVRLAFETDSTRSVSLMLDGFGTPALALPDAQIMDGYHSLSHHGKSPEKCDQLKIIDRWHMKLLGELLRDLKAVREGGETLLDRTMVFYGSNLGDSNNHTSSNMPVLLAGGGFRHGQHLAFNPQDNYPLPNLFVSMLRQMGLETERFGPSTGTMRGLEPA